LEFHQKTLSESQKLKVTEKPDLEALNLEESDPDFYADYEDEEDHLDYYDEPETYPSDGEPDHDD